MADIGNVKYTKLEPDLDGIKEERTNDSTNGRSGRMKEELIDVVAMEEPDVGTGIMDPLGSCSDTDNKPEIIECSASTEFLLMSQALEKNKPHLCEVYSSGLDQKSVLRKRLLVPHLMRAHVCHICGKGFRQGDSLNKHLRTHSGERPYVCKTCGKGFKQVHHLKNHERTHTGERPYVCDVCGMMFKESNHLRRHSKKHTRGRPRACDICGEGFKDDQSLKNHKMTHTEGGYSSTSVPGTADCMAHFTEVKYTEEEPIHERWDKFSAPHSIREQPELDLPSSESSENAKIVADVGEFVVCVKLEPELDGIKEEPTNDSTDEFQQLPPTIKEEPEVTFPCDGRSGRTKEELIADVTMEELDVDTVDMLGSCSDTKNKSEASEHSALNKEFLGDMCSSGFGQKRDLRDHTRTHTGERPHVCDICGSAFSRNVSLKEHMRTHTGEKPYICDICGSGFSRNDHLKVHRRTHTGERPYVCDFCGSRFSTRPTLTNHKRSHTGERPYACDICGSKFMTFSTLRNHKRSHEGEKRYVCDFCNSGFMRSDTLKVHIRTHTGEKPYICDTCGLGFKDKSSLKNHKKTHTGKHPLVGM